MTIGHDSSRKVLDGKVYSPVGFCIYCGSTQGLTNEHILPLALNGTAVLPKSSCQTCAKETGRIEQILLRGSLWPARVFRDLKSRTKHRDAPKTYPVTVVFGGQESTLQIAIEKLPILIPFPVFAPPRVISRKPLANGIDVASLDNILFGKSPEELARELGATGLRIGTREDPNVFARVVAKIAYSFACAEGVLKDLAEPSPVLPAILGQSANIGNWVGTLDHSNQAHPQTLHRINLMHEEQHRLLLAEVQLFADSQTPSYAVVLGRLNDLNT